MVITVTEQPIHDLNYRSAMVQSWNKLCFQGGYIEVRMSLPGSPQIAGFWPGKPSSVVHFDILVDIGSA